MSPLYRYRTISEPLLHELASHLECGDSLVILGPPNVGKGFVRRKLRYRLERNGYGPVVRINFRGRGVTDVAAARAAVAAVVREAGLPAFEGESILSPLEGAEGTVYLFISNPDSLPHRLARRLLHELRSLVDDRNDRNERKVVALVCGEHDLGELVHGPASEFNVAQHYMLQNFDREIFDEFLDDYARVLRFDLDKDARDVLWKETAGVGDQIRSLLTALVESRVRPRPPVFQSDVTRPISAGEVEHVINHLPEFGLPPRYFLRHVARLLAVERAGKVFTGFQRLLAGEVVVLDQPAGSPRALTLSGLCIRAEGTVRFSSPLIERLAKTHYSPERLAQVHAAAGRFDRAFALCGESGAKTFRDDQAVLSDTERSAASALHRKAAAGRIELWDFFRAVCLKLFGLSEVSFWEFRTAWTPTQGEPSAELKRVALSALALDYRDRETDEYLAPMPCSGSVLGWRLQGSSKNWAFAVFVGDAKEQGYLAQEVALLLRDFAEQLRVSHRRAVSEDEEKRQRDFLRAEASLMERLHRKFAEGDPRVQEILAETEALRILGYRRIALALIDPYDRMIYPVSDDADVPLLEGIGPWHVDQYNENIHPYVLKYRCEVVIERAEGHPLTTPAAVARGEIEAMAVVPIFGLSSEAIGTIHFERSDKKVPSLEEVEDFKRFGRKLGLLIEQGKRLQLLQGALDRTREALAVFNSHNEPYFADEQARERFGFSRGWASRVPADRTAPTESQAVLAGIAATAFRNGRLVQLERSLPGAKGETYSILADQLPGWRGQPTASFLSILNLTEDYKVFEAFKALSLATDQESGKEKLLDAVRILGHQWARIYVYRDGNLVSSPHQYGATGEDKVRFEGGEIALEGKDSMRCLREGRLIVFCKFQKNKEPVRFRTPLGLEVEGTPESNSGFLDKPEGSLWIEAPLIADGKWLGKISLECGDDVRPERVDFLRAFFELVSRLLEALSRAQKEAFRRSMAELSHSLYAQVTWLNKLRYLYRLQEREWRPNELSELTNRLESGLEQIDNGLLRAKDSFSLKPPAYEPFDILQLLAQELPQNATTVLADERPFEIEADRQYLSVALKEIVANSESFRPSGLRFTVRVAARDCEGAEWCEIEIEDNGPGFPAHLKNDRAFDHFVTHRVGVHQSPGTGLGLAIVRRKVELHGGTVEIEKDTAGACIRIRIPRRPVRKSACEEIA